MCVSHEFIIIKVTLFLYIALKAVSQGTLHNEKISRKKKTQIKSQNRLVV